MKSHLLTHNVNNGQHQHSFHFIALLTLVMVTPHCIRCCSTILECSLPILSRVFKGLSTLSCSSQSALEWSLDFQVATSQGQFVCLCGAVRILEHCSVADTGRYQRVASGFSPGFMWNTFLVHAVHAESWSEFKSAVCCVSVRCFTCNIPVQTAQIITYYLFLFHLFGTTLLAVWAPTTSHGTLYNRGIIGCLVSVVGFQSLVEFTAFWLLEQRCHS